MSRKATLMRKIQRIGEQLREYSNVDFAFVVIQGDGPPEKPHRMSIDTNVSDDHHMLDILTGLTGAWHKAAH